jgi:hypothetical protein
MIHRKIISTPTVWASCWNQLRSLPGLSRRILQSHYRALEHYFLPVTVNYIRPLLVSRKAVCRSSINTVMVVPCLIFGHYIRVPCCTAIRICLLYSLALLGNLYFYYTRDVLCRCYPVPFERAFWDRHVPCWATVVSIDNGPGLRATSWHSKTSAIFGPSHVL